MSEIIRIVLADDDLDDCLFFTEALKNSGLYHTLNVVNDGEQLMQYLSNTATILPNVLFLDLNMPRKNGFECLLEIKQSQIFSSLPVIIFSTSFEQSVVNTLYDNGARYFIRKPPDFARFNQIVVYVLRKIFNESANPPLREDFIITMA